MYEYDKFNTLRKKISKSWHIFNNLYRKNDSVLTDEEEDSIALRTKRKRRRKQTETNTNEQQSDDDDDEDTSCEY